jgi:hypothetical protein
MLISFDKPKKLRSTSEHNNTYMPDTNINGTYVPNMSIEDELKWKGKHIKGDNERIEIRKTLGSQLLIIVYKNKHKSIYKDWREKTRDHDDIKISMNGPLQLSWEEYDEFKLVIEEAKEILNNE